ESTERRARRGARSATVVGSILRVICLLVALVLVGAGGIGVLLQRSASDPQLRDHRRQIEQLAGRSMLPPVLLRGWTPYALVGSGIAIALGAVAAGGRGGGARPARPRPASGAGRALGTEPIVDRRLARKLERQALAMARKGMVVEAAELCADAGLLDRAAELFTEAGDYVRAAGIRHDQNRF